MNRTGAAGTALALVALLGGCGGSSEEVASPSPSPEDSAAAAAEARRLAQNAAAASAEAAAEAEASAAAAALPVAEDFRIGTDVLEKQCFGSAGCNITFRISVQYVGPNDPNSTEVTYEVLGGTDPLINTFTIDANGDALVDSEEFISTPSADAELTAKATRVRRT